MPKSSPTVSLFLFVYREDLSLSVNLQVCLNVALQEKQTISNNDSHNYGSNIEQLHFTMTTAKTKLIMTTRTKCTRFGYFVRLLLIASAFSKEASFIPPICRYKWLVWKTLQKISAKSPGCFEFSTSEAMVILNREGICRIISPDTGMLHHKSSFKHPGAIIVRLAGKGRVGGNLRRVISGLYRGRAQPVSFISNQSFVSFIFS